MKYTELNHAEMQEVNGGLLGLDGLLGGSGMLGGLLGGSSSDTNNTSSDLGNGIQLGIGNSSTTYESANGDSYTTRNFQVGLGLLTKLFGSTM